MMKKVASHYTTAEKKNPACFCLPPVRIFSTSVYNHLNPEGLNLRNIHSKYCNKKQEKRPLTQGC